MNLESIKERIIEQWNSIWEQISDSDLYIQLRERYHNLSPTMQKITLGIAVTFLGLFLLLIPFSYLSSSWDSVAGFENNVTLLRDLYRVQRELASTPMVPDPPTSSEISAQVQSLLTQVGITGDQVSGPREIAPERESSNALQPQGISEHGVEVVLMKLNVKQVAEIGAKFSQMGNGLHVTALDMKANAQNDHYYDVIFRITGFTVAGAAPGAIQEPPEPAPTKNSAPLPPPPGRSRNSKGAG